MGRKSTRENKTIYQLSREAAGLTREAAGEMMYMSEDRIEKFESERSPARPEEVIEMAKCYDDPTLCNLYCAKECPIGQKHVAVVKNKELPQVTMEILNAINALYRQRDRLVEIAADEELSEEAMDDLIDITVRLEHLSQSIDSMQLWLKQKIKK